MLLCTPPQEEQAADRLIEAVMDSQESDDESNEGAVKEVERLPLLLQQIRSRQPGGIQLTNIDVAELKAGLGGLGAAEWAASLLDTWLAKPGGKMVVVLRGDAVNPSGMIPYTLFSLSLGVMGCPVLGELSQRPLAYQPLLLVRGEHAGPHVFLLRCCSICAPSALLKIYVMEK